MVTKKELIETLNQYDDNAIIMISTDNEGNGFAHIDDNYGVENIFGLETIVLFPVIEENTSKHTSDIIDTNDLRVRTERIWGNDNVLVRVKHAPSKLAVFVEGTTQLKAYNTAVKQLEILLKEQSKLSEIQTIDK